MAIRLADGPYIDRTSNLWAMNANYTIMAWVRIAAHDADYSHFWGLRYLLASGYSIYDHVGLNTGATIRLRAEIEYSGWYNALGSELSLDTWYHITAIRSSYTDYSVYLNGVLDVGPITRDVTGRTYTANILRIGAFPTTDDVRSSNARFSSLKIWQAALSVAEIKTEMRSIIPRRIANLNAWYPMFGGATERYLDYGAGSYAWSPTGTITDEEGPPVPWGTFSIWMPTLRSSSAVGFNASGDYAKRTGSPAITMTGDTDKVTMAGWMKYRNTSPGAHSFGFGFEDADTSSSRWALIGITNLNQSRFSIFTQAINWSPAPSQDTWYYFYITIENIGSNLANYSAGYYSADSSSPVDSGTISNQAEFNIARICIGNDSYDEWVDGVFAYVRVWTGVILTDSELRAERDSATAVKTSGLWADWPLADNTDTGDDSGNGRDLTFGGTLTNETGPLLATSLSVSVSDSITVTDTPTVEVEDLFNTLFVRVTPAANYVQIVTP